MSRSGALRLFVAITDTNWFDHLAERAARGSLEDVNFWRPSGLGFQALNPGDLFLFKLHSPRSVIAGGGIFTRSMSLPAWYAWDVFGLANGVKSEAQMLERIAHYRSKNAGLVTRETKITCIVLSESFFFAPGDELQVPDSLSRHVQVGKCYSTESQDGLHLYRRVTQHMARSVKLGIGPAQAAIIEGNRFGVPKPVAPRLGQSGFRLGVTAAYDQRCAMTGERTLPVLEAAHIRPYSDGGGHDLHNGILLRRDLHRLFDLGYLAVSPSNLQVLVSGRIKTEFQNGREYYALAGRPLRLPGEHSAVPDPELLRFHLDTIYRE